MSSFIAPPPRQPPAQFDTHASHVEAAVVSSDTFKFSVLESELARVRAQADFWRFMFLAAVLAFFALLLSGCGATSPAPPDFTTPAGVRVYMDGVTDSGLDGGVAGQIEDFLLNGAGKLGFDDGRARVGLAYSEVHWLAEAGFKSNGVEVGGTNYDFYIQVADSNPDCPDASAYGHELMHSIVFAQTQDWDVNHASPAWAVVGDLGQLCYPHGKIHMGVMP